MRKMTFTADEMRKAAHCLSTCEIKMDFNFDKRDEARMLRQGADAIEREQAKDEIIKLLKSQLWDAITEHCYNCEYSHDGYHHRIDGEQCQNPSMLCVARSWRDAIKKVEEVLDER